MDANSIRREIKILANNIKDRWHKIDDYKYDLNKYEQENDHYNQIIEDNKMNINILKKIINEEHEEIIKEELIMENLEKNKLLDI